VRTRNRTLDNQVELLAAIANSLIAKHPGCELVIDGHTLAEDNERLITDMHDRSNREIAKSDKRVTNQIIARLSLERGKVFATAGKSTLHAIALAQHVDCYICHHGTVQHKIGWFTSAPGVVHCNRELTEAGPAESVAQQSEGATVPTYFPLDMIVDAGSDERDPVMQALSHGNYRIDDIPEACAFVLRELERAVPGGLADRVDTPTNWERLVSSCVRSIRRLRRRLAPPR
jgi:hypothetical protein